MARCYANAASTTAIPILERKLTNAKVELPPRYPKFDYLRPR